MSLLAIAVAPCIAIILFVYARDKYDKEPKKLLFYSFLGGLLSVFVAIQLGNVVQGITGFDGTGGTFNIAGYACLTVALCEELGKYLFLRAIPYRNPAFNEPFDGIVYSVMVSMGFAMLENILYVYQYGMGTGIMRALTAVPAHGTFAVIMGYYVGKAKFAKNGRTLLHLIGIAGAVLFHGAYDFSLFQNALPSLKFIGAIVSLIVALRLSFIAMKKSEKLHEMSRG